MMTLPDPSQHYAAAVQTGNGFGLVRRIRVPTATDVLSGRGGSVNQHQGNIDFRRIVNNHKYQYNLAPSKGEKAAICLDVITQVKKQNPPGRFLGREDDNSTWWIELDEERIMAKTSQALREGAPKIREEHHIGAAPKQKKKKTESLPTLCDVKKPQSSQVIEPMRMVSPLVTPTTPPLATVNPSTTIHPMPSQEIMKETQTQPLKSTIYSSALPKLMNGETKTSTNTISYTSNPKMGVKRARVEAERINDAAPVLHQSSVPSVPKSSVSSFSYLTKQEETISPDDETPPLMPQPSPTHNHIEPLALSGQFPYPLKKGMKRSHSLALSETDTAYFGEFVNPFANEDNLCSSKSSTMDFPCPRIGLLRESSVSSNGDLGGYGALLRDTSVGTFCAPSSEEGSSETTDEEDTIGYKYM